WAAGVGAGVLLLAARAAAAIPGAAVDLPAVTAPALVALALVPLAARHLTRPGGPSPAIIGLPWRALAALGLCGVVGAWALTRPGAAAPWPLQPSVTALDIGQGDSILLRSPEGGAVIVDTGPPGAPAPVVAALRRQGVSRLDVLVMTHDSLDHIGGVTDILDRFDVGVVVHPPDPVDGWEPAARRALRAVTAHGVPVREVRAGALIVVGRWSLRVLSPSGRRPVGADPNPYSMV
ncbi:unnamed protein product, partial [Phaeothamnion confervicola]